MSRRPRPPRGGRTGTAKARPSFTPPEHDPLADSRLLPLVERYAGLAGAGLAEVGPHLFELRVPEGDRAFFDGRDQLLLATAVPAIEHAPEAEMVVVGGPVVEQLLAAIRARGGRRSLGVVAAAAAPAAAPPAPPLRGGALEPPAVGKPTVRKARHRVGRLLARVLVRAGAAVEEHLVEGGFLDLATGVPLPPDVAAHCAAVERQRAASGPAARQAASATRGARAVPPLPAAGLVERMVADLRPRLAPRIDHLRAEADRALAGELQRIDRYFRAMLEAVTARGGDGEALAAAGKAIEAEHARRRAEEEQRHQVRVVVHPLQLVEMEMPVERAEWTLATAGGGETTLSARRYLGGHAAWVVSCPACGRQPAALLLCRDGALACEGCGRECSACGGAFRAGETAECHVDGKAACADHARTCSACQRTHCSAHVAECAEGAHPTCTSCLAPCASCNRTVCASHAVATAEGAPQGSRRLCPQCVVGCEGRQSEPVGRDEAVACASCDRFVCEEHQVACEVDNAVHCSTHLTRTDRSRRLVCAADRGRCDHEGDAVFAADEVAPCVTCARSACEEHAAACAEDGAWHCRAHLAPLTDRPGAYACEAHRTLCQVGGEVVSPAGTIECPVCARRACVAHARSCDECGRRVCVEEWDTAAARCTPCAARPAGA